MEGYYKVKIFLIEENEYFLFHINYHHTPPPATLAFCSFFPSFFLHFPFKPFASSSKSFFPFHFDLPNQAKEEFISLIRRNSILSTTAVGPLAPSLHSPLHTHLPSYFFYLHSQCVTPLLWPSIQVKQPIKLNKKDTILHKVSSSSFFPLFSTLLSNFFLLLPYLHTHRHRDKAVTKLGDWTRGSLCSPFPSVPTHIQSTHRELRALISSLTSSSPLDWSCKEKKLKVSMYVSL